MLHLPAILAKCYHEHSSYHAAQLIQAVDQFGPSSDGAGDRDKNKGQEGNDAKNSDLVNMHHKIAQASVMSSKARRRRASVVFLPPKPGDDAPQIELKPLEKYHSKVGRKGSYMMA